MEIIKTLIDSAITIMSININLFGYNITLINVAIYGVLGSIVMWFVFRLFR